jgi:hypothetical protein
VTAAVKALRAPAHPKAEVPLKMNTVTTDDHQYTHSNTTISRLLIYCRQLIVHS